MLYLKDNFNQTQRPLVNAPKAKNSQTVQNAQFSKFKPCLNLS